MRIPEPLFAIINLIARLLLCSPFHGVLSGSILLVRFTGRVSGKSYTTPVRYIDDAHTVRFFTSKDTQWWKNMRGEVEVVLRIQGKEQCYRTSAITDSPGVIRPFLIELLQRYPQDAAYHEITLTNGKVSDENGFERALTSTVMIVATRVISDSSLSEQKQTVPGGNVENV
jgi:hypothetical protein